MIETVQRCFSITYTRIQTSWQTQYVVRRQHYLNHADLGVVGGGSDTVEVKRSDAGERHFRVLGHAVGYFRMAADREVHEGSGGIEVDRFSVAGRSACPAFDCVGGNKSTQQVDRVSS